MIARARKRIELLKTDRDLFRKLNPLILADILELWACKVFSAEETQLVMSGCARSEEARLVLDKLLDAHAWSKTSAGQKWIAVIEERLVA
jgi:hypothetical protein